MPAAAAEAREELAYILDQSGHEAAMRWHAGFEAAVNSLGEMPRACAVAREQEAFPDVELRQLLYHAHRIVFLVRGDEVIVLHVRHAARRDLGNL
ncbi:MAG: type II toxin-antitoxin system RelE/ParE family toxin [Phycisphaeraceae bacterium]